MTMRGIDTLAIARKLEAAGIDRGQAKRMPKPSTRSW